MSVEAFVWFYKDQECAAVELDEVFKAFGDAVTGWTSASGLLQLEFGGWAESCEVYLSRGEAEEGKVGSIMISRPVQAPALWRGVLHLMGAHRGMLFFSDDTTPYFRDVGDAEHYPDDLLAELGTPTQIQSPEELPTLRLRA